jgi:uncharacterized protein
VARSAAFIDGNFRAPIGFATAAVAASATLQPKPQVDENIALARFAHLLHAHTARDSHRAIAEHAMRYLAAPAVVESLGFGTSGVLLVDRELRAEPVHITIVGKKDDPRARELFETALRGAPMPAQIEWFDRREGPLPRTDVPYPDLAEPAAFFCSKGSCSSPMTTPAQLAKKLPPR